MGGKLKKFTRIVAVAAAATMATVGFVTAPAHAASKIGRAHV